jgi:hypothetical protein
MGELEAHLLAVLFLLVFGAAGLAMATNFRGFTVRHARRSVGMFGQPTEERVARQTALEKIIGWAFAAVAALCLVITLSVW